MNIRTLSKLSGISVCTLSRVLSGRAREYRISEETEAKVLKLAAEHDYRPNYLARSLNTGQTHTIGVVLTNFLDRFLGQILEGVEAELRASPYQITVSTCENSLDLQNQSLEALAHRRVDGILLYPSAVPAGSSYRLPAVLKDGHSGPPIVVVGRDMNLSCDKVFFADQPAGADAARRLLHKGCRRFVFVTNSSNCSSDQGRGEGFVAALREEGVEARHIETVLFNEGQWTAMPKWRADVGLFGVNTGLLVDFLEHRGAATYPDIRHLVSVGAMQGHHLIPLPWDTLNTPNRTMGEEAARTLLWRMQNTAAPAKHLHLPIRWD